MLFNGVLAAVGLAMVIPMFVPSRWRAHRVDDRDGGHVADVDETTVAPAVQPTQLTPVGASSLAPLPAAPWHDAGTPATRLATDQSRQP
jgi:hypothetical protein